MYFLKKNKIQRCHLILKNPPAYYISTSHETKKYHLKKIKQPILKKENCPFQRTWIIISTPQPPETAATFSVLKVDSKDLIQSLAALLN